MTAPTLRRATVVAGLTAVVLVASACGATPAASTAPSSSTAPVESASSAAPVEPLPSAVSSPSASAATSPAASLATSGRVVIADQGFAVTLPDGWTRIDLAAKDIDALIEAAGAQNPELAWVYTQQIRAMAAQGLVLFAFGPNMADGTNVNILSTPSMGLSLEFLEQANLAQLGALVDGEIASERVQLPAGEAVHLRYAMSAGTGTPSPTIEQYFLLNGDKQLVVSVTNASEVRAPGPRSVSTTSPMRQRSALPRSRPSDHSIMLADTHSA